MLEMGQAMVIANSKLTHKIQAEKSNRNQEMSAFIKLILALK